LCQLLRFEIGPLRPPMAQFERVQHLADQMGILNVIADRLRTACDINTAELQPGPHTA
jgi:transposase